MIAPNCHCGRPLPHPDAHECITCTDRRYGLRVDVDDGGEKGDAVMTTVREANRAVPVVQRVAS